MKHVHVPNSSRPSRTSLDDSTSQGSGVSLSLRRRLMAKAASWHVGKRKSSRQRGKRSSERNIRCVESEVAALETLVQEYKKEHEKNQGEVQALIDAKSTLASQLADISEKYIRAVDEKQYLCSKLQDSEHGIENLKRQVELLQASNAQKSSFDRAKRSRHGYYPQQRQPHRTAPIKDNLLTEYKQELVRANQALQAQAYIPTAEAVAVPCTGPIAVQPTNRTGSSRADTLSMRPRRSQATSLEEYFDEMNIKGKQGNKSRTSSSRRSRVTVANHDCSHLRTSESSAFRRYTPR